MLDANLNEVIRTTKSHLGKLNDIGVRTTRDLLQYYPWRYSDESEFTKISHLKIGETMTVKGRLKKIFARKTKTGKLMISAKFYDETGEIDVMWFNQTYLRSLLKDEMEIILTGKLKWSGSRGSFMGPKYEIPGKGQELVHTGRLVPVYHETEKISSKWLREKIRPLLYMSKYFDEPLPSDVVEENDLMPFKEAVSQVHFPDNDEALKRARYRLGFQELLAIQLGVLMRKEYWKRVGAKSGKEILTNKKIVQQFLEKLPFTLTSAQSRAVDEICEDLSKPIAMSRLLEGDVGSGKTVVAALSVYLAINSGYQAVVMAPTEILAKQHYKTMYKYLKDFGFNIQLLTGSLTKAQKDQLVGDMNTGTVDLVVGTHAIIQEGVGFKNLGLAVIDEQHRFGVNQRAILKEFGVPHVLSMTATPIPRTLALTLYGDQDLSIIDELPPGRQEIVTRVVPEKKREDAYRWISDQVEQGRQAFVVCPLIEESETLEVKSAVDEFERLRDNVFPQFNLGLIHGRLKQSDKDMIMQKFVDKEIDILVSTTVIEVGIDVPNATIMLVEGADRFGLAQLHQLRGRVGRGEHQSYCFLFTESNSELSRKRMKAMVEFSDGFKLAEIDLELRGPGEVYGTRQSGIPDLKMASLSDAKLVKQAREVAEKILVQNSPSETFSKLERLLGPQNVAVDY